MKKYLLCLSWLVLSCTTPKSLPVGAAPSGNTIASPDHILFLTMNISLDTVTAESSIRVLNTVSKEGTLKRDIRPERSNGAQLKCELLAGDIVIDSFLTEHPLFKDIEYINDRSAFDKKQVQLTSEDFFIRFQQGRADHVRITELLPAAKPRQLLNTKLP